MPNPGLSPTEMKEALDAYQREGSVSAAARSLNMHRTTYQSRLKKAQEEHRRDSFEQIAAAGYDLNAEEKTPEQAWREHASVFERVVSKARREQWRTIQRNGPFVIYHGTDQHVDDDKTPLNLLEADIKASHDLGAIMCHGGDVLNNWPVAGRLAKQWAEQQCTLPDALLRAKYYFGIMKPDVAVHGNHEEMNPYLAEFLNGLLPKGCISGYWAVNFAVEVPNGRTIRAVLSHKFQKGSSWFHKTHGHIREMLEGEEADVFMDGHVHSDGVLDHSLPEREYAALLVASAGYKVLDKYAARISRGGKKPKLRGRAHWIVCDPFAEYDENTATAFKSPEQAEAYLNGLQNLRAA